MGLCTQKDPVQACGQNLTDAIHHINGLVQDCSNSIANALELLQLCTKSWMSCVFDADISEGYCIYWSVILQDSVDTGWSSKSVQRKEFFQFEFILLLHTEKVHALSL